MAESEHPKPDPAVSHCPAASFSPACPKSHGLPTAWVGRTNVPLPSLLSPSAAEAAQRRRRRMAAKVLKQMAHTSTSCLTNPKFKPAAHAQGRDDRRSDPATGSGDRGWDLAGCDTEHSPGLARGR